MLSTGVLLHAQPPPALPPLDVRVPLAPRLFVSDGRHYLVYELHITNMSARQTVLDGLDVMDAADPERQPIASLKGEVLSAVLQPFGTPLDHADRRALPPGRSTVAFMWLALDEHSIPTTVTHRFQIAVSSPAGADTQLLSVQGVAVSVDSRAARAIGPPLQGDHWLAANGPDNASDHRRTLFALSGEARISQRYAIDWVRIDMNGRTFTGDALKNSSYYAFGANVLAVADGTVAKTVDGIPENIPDPDKRAVPLTVETIGGNYILLDLHDGRFAVYAHLQPGSLRVHVGDHVRRGQVMALVGNTGNSTEPHLHFHVVDRSSPFDAEGIPYTFASYRLEAAPSEVTSALVPIGNSIGIDPLRLATWKAAGGQLRYNEMPVMNAIVEFLR